MNLFLAVILASLIGVYLLHLTARRLNAAALSPDLPPEFADMTDAKKYARSQEYARANMRFQNVSETVSLLLVLGFILLGGFNALDLAVRSLGMGPLATGLAFCGALALFSSITDLPLDIYHTFVLEKRFGFNTTTAATFVADRIKGLVLGAVLGGVLLTAILWFLRVAGQQAWLWCWGFAVAFSLLLTYIGPQWLLPIFNRFTPLESGELRTAIEQYAHGQNFALSGIFVMDGSKRSTKANAFFTGFGRTRRIALFDTLMNRHDTDEIVGVLAHEVGHAKLGHIKKRLLASILQTGLLFYFMSLFLDNHALFDAFGMQHVSHHAGLVFLALLYTPVSLCLSLAANAMSRKHEFQADAFAATTTGNPYALARALKRLSVDSLSNLTPHPLTVWLGHGHPPVLQRIRRLESMGAADSPD